MTPQTHQVLKEAVEILNRIQGQGETKKWFKELTLHNYKKQNRMEKNNGTGAKV
jgi:hypothetical protein